MARAAKKKSKEVAVKSANRKTVPAKKRASTAKVAAPRRAAKKIAAKKGASTKIAAPRRAAKKVVAKKRAASLRVPTPKPAAKKSASLRVVTPKPAAKKTASRLAVAKKTPLPVCLPNGRLRAEVQRLRAHTNGRRMDGATAFLPDPTAIGHRRVKDEFAEELGEEFVSAATSGESVDDARDATVPEEDGGPFITTNAKDEYGQGTDASNPADAEREAFPTTRGGR